MILLNIEQMIFTGLTNGAIYALIAIGIVIIYNVTGIINFAQGEFPMLGAMIVITLSSLGMHIIVASFLSILIVVFISIIIYGIGIYPLKDTKNSLTTIMVTFGFGIIMTGVALIIWGTDSRPLKPFTGEAPITLLNASITHQSLWIIGTCALVIIGIFILFDKTYFGMAFKACISNKSASRLMGIPTEMMGLFAFALSAGIGALAGIIMAPATFASYEMGVMLSLKGFVAAILGGLSGAPAAIVGGFALGLIESLGAGFISSGYIDFIAFGTLILIMLIRPNGILGKKKIKKV